MEIQHEPSLEPIFKTAVKVPCLVKYDNGHSIDTLFLNEDTSINNESSVSQEISFDNEEKFVYSPDLDLTSDYDPINISQLPLSNMDLKKKEQGNLQQNHSSNNILDFPQTFIRTIDITVNRKNETNNLQNMNSKSVKDQKNTHNYSEEDKISNLMLPNFLETKNQWLNNNGESSSSSFSSFYPINSEIFNSSVCVSEQVEEDKIFKNESNEIQNYLNLDRCSKPNDDQETLKKNTFKKPLSDSELKPSTDQFSAHYPQTKINNKQNEDDNVLVNKMRNLLFQIRNEEHKAILQSLQSNYLKERQSIGTSRQSWITRYHSQNFTKDPNHSQKNSEDLIKIHKQFDLLLESLEVKIFKSLKQFESHFLSSQHNNNNKNNNNNADDSKSKNKVKNKKKKHKKTKYSFQNQHRKRKKKQKKHDFKKQHLSQKESLGKELKKRRYLNSKKSSKLKKNKYFHNRQMEKKDLKKAKKRIKEKLRKNHKFKKFEKINLKRSRKKKNFQNKMKNKEKEREREREIDRKIEREIGKRKDKDKINSIFKKKIKKTNSKKRKVNYLSDNLLLKKKNNLKTKNRLKDKNFLKRKEKIYDIDWFQTTDSDSFDSDELDSLLESLSDSLSEIGGDEFDKKRSKKKKLIKRARLDPNAKMILNNWITERVTSENGPYATKEEKNKLAEESRISVKQITAYLGNARNKIKIQVKKGKIERPIWLY
ncbi:homeobox protein meis2 [Anaeramoeba flamelloides]|uniref:Homeobox protein meis2 n=1 Tax=Anaeramoeba flamelloides TaxID=1746091 RepID=A0AAV7ZX83_9EUKA|nr:homeobox protein meis2 [Anaeramoeba flamelloides]